MTNGFSDPQQLDAFFAATYEDRRRLADLVRRRVSELHFKRIAASVMRQEIAELLGISEATVPRDWRAAKAGLAQEVRKI